MDKRTHTDERRIEELARQALDIGPSTRINRAARDRIAARLGIAGAERRRRWPWLVGAAAAATVIVVAIVVSQLGGAPVARESQSPVPTTQPSPTAAESASPRATSSPAPAVAFGRLPPLESDGAAAGGGLDPNELRFTSDPDLVVPDAAHARVGEVVFASWSREDAEAWAERFGFAGAPEEFQYGQITDWVWREDGRRLSVRDDGAIEYGDPGGGQGPAAPVGDPIAAARQWLAARSINVDRLATDPEVREIGDGRVSVNFNPAPSEAEAASMDYYLRPGSGAFPYALVTLLADGSVQQASYREVEAGDVSRYPLRPAADVLELLESAVYPIVGQRPPGTPPDAVGEAIVESVQLSYQLVRGTGHVSYLVPVYRVSGAVTWPQGASSEWRASVPAIAPEWTER